MWQLEVGDGVCGGVSYLGLMEMHICRRGPRLMPGRTELGVTTAILGGFIQPLCRIWGPMGCGG